MSEKEMLDKARKMLSVEMVSPGHLQRRLGVSYFTAEHLKETLVDELKEAAIILRRFQDWRKGYDVRTIADAGINSVELSEAIDLILGFMDFPEPLTDCKNCKSNNESVFCQRVIEGKECKFERVEE
jgi:hypothetical protein